MKTKKMIYKVLYSLLIGFAIVACNDDIGDNIYTKRVDLIGQYMEHHPEYYSEFYTLLEKTEMLGLVNSYGLYTCFIPTNDAVKSFFAESEFGSVDNFPLDSLKKVVLYQMIENDTISFSDFTGDGRLRSPNMRRDYLQARSQEGKTIINSRATVLLADQRVHNGIIHMTDAMLVPDTSNVAGKLDNPIFQGRYSIFRAALEETGLIYKVQESVDPREFSYKKTVENQEVTVVIPKMYRYTLLAESNEVFHKAGITDYDALKAKYDDGNGDITSATNGLYRFIAYHCLDRLYDYSQFIQFSQQDGYEIIETMCENTLLEFRNYPEGVIFNRFKNADGVVIYNGARITSDGTYRNIMSNNGMIHELADVLEIPDQRIYFNKKMRFNVASFLPELMNYGCRGKTSLELPDAKLRGPQYFDNLSITWEAGYVIPRYDYTTTWIRHQFDEILIGSGWFPWDQETTGKMGTLTRYDVSMIIPPIPVGMWEVRFGYTANGDRGMAQIYFDGTPAGIPLWMGEADTKYYGIDGMDEETARKVLYNNSYMPFPANVKDGGGSAAPYSRTDRLRRIIGTYNFSEMKKHVMRFKTVESGQLSLNFIEVIPVDQIADEDFN